MALDRQSIEKRDFPIGRRGYEPDAVDGHLAMLADEVDALKRAAARPSRQDSVASAASEQVRLIVQAAEESAAEIEREAEQEATDIRRDARQAADQARADAGDQAREHVERVAEATATMLERADVLESEFGSLLEGVRSSAQRLAAELQALQGAVTEIRGSTHALEIADEEDEPAPVAASSARYEPPVAEATPPVVEPEPEPEPVVEPEPVADVEVVVEDEPEPVIEPEVVPEPEIELEVVEEVPEEEEPVATTTAAPSAIEAGDEEGARLIALNMALNGTPRDETERYLGDNFQLANTSALLDDVYARAGG